MRRRRLADVPDDPRPSLIDDQQDRFKKPNWANFRRWKIANWRAGEAHRCKVAGELEEAAKHEAVSRAALAGTLSFSSGPPVPIASRRPARSEPPEGP